MLTLLAMDFTRAGAVHAQSGAFRARVHWKQDGRLRGGTGPRRPTREAAEVDLESMRAVTGGPPLPGVLSLYPFGIKDGPSSVPLAMYHPIGFACQVQRYINEGLRSFSDAPSASLVRRLPKNHGGIFLSFSLKSFVRKTSVSVDLSHS